ncbi:hypothetical protein [Rhodococcus sp. NPDC127528]|uniref:hypothetical protein n=1 Tax=unclassified Rhodococcus (in: high G+C Gram-positive bacteria) TaxID=192944 RepID=UPI003633175A
MNRARRRQQLEMLIGLLGFFTAVSFLAAAAGIVRGNPGLTASLVLLGCVAALALAIRAWRKVR